MSKFLQEMAKEASVRIAAYKSERDVLLKATARIQELDALIAEAEEEHTSIDARIPKDKDELVAAGLV